LPCDVRPGERSRLWAAVKSPAEPGDYDLVLTLVQENVTWFDAAGIAPQTLRIHVE
jgi:hypothetical protein